MSEKTMRQGKCMLITGASSGMGATLAREAAASGYSLALVARRMDRLQELSEELSGPNNRITCHKLNIQDSAAIDDVFEEIAQIHDGIDVVVVNAGITGVSRTGKSDRSLDVNIFQTNLIGATACVHAAVAIFRRQEYGHVVGISSISAFNAIPGSAAYSASKAGLTNYLRAVRSELHSKPIDITIIHPGFVATEISPGIEKFPFAISAESAGRRIMSAINRKKKEATIPWWPWVPMGWISRLLPDSLTRKMMS